MIERTYSQYSENFRRASVAIPCLQSFSNVAANASAFFRALFSVHVSCTSNVVVHGFSCLPSTPRPRWTRIQYEISFAMSASVDIAVSNLVAQYTASCWLMYWNDFENVSERRFLVELLSDQIPQELCKGLIRCGCWEIRFSGLPDSN